MRVNNRNSKSNENAEDLFLKKLAIQILDSSMIFMISYARSPC